MKAASGILLILLFVGIFGLAFNVQPVEASRTIYIRADGSVDPLFAPIERQEDTYTFTANISESIVIQRNNTVVDGKGYNLKGDGTGNGFDLPNMENITIKNTKISNFSTGIHLYYSTRATLVNNTITECVYGILPSNSPNSTITNNTIANNHWDGIFLTYSDHNVLENNVIANHSKWGIYLGSSTGITLKNNKMLGNSWNFGVSVNFIHDIDDSNSVDGKPIYYLVNQQNKQIPANAGYVAAIGSSNITVRNLSLTKNGQGVVLVNSKNCLIENSIITKMGYYGIQLFESDSNSIRNNNVSNNRPPYFGVGIVFSQSTANTVSGNVIQNNERGILLYDSSANKIYRNSFVENTRQASSEDSKNSWDDTYPSGGNYWSDYAGIDSYNGPYQNETGSDGIGDTLYVIDANNADKYPLMKPWVPTPSTRPAAVDVDPDTLNLKSEGKWVTCYIELPENYNVSDIDRATILLNSTIQADPFWIDKPLESIVGDHDNDTVPDLMVKFNRTAVSRYIFNQNTTCESVTLTLTGKLSDDTQFEASDTITVRTNGEVNSTSEYIDVSDLVIPEFSSSTIPLTLLVLFLIAVVVTKLKKRKDKLFHSFLHS